MVIWKVCPIQGPQLKDVRKEDLVANGHFRICDTYRGGGGYDKFPAICKRRLGLEGRLQFVVQLYGCHLRCPYCYVTEAGYLGRWVPYTSDKLVQVYKQTNSKVFHLMGGSPAIYLNQWSEIIDRLDKNTVFHSDLLLTEHDYNINALTYLHRPNVLLAIGIKGTSDNEWKENTGRNPNWHLFWSNLYKVFSSGVNFYFTFTNVSSEGIERFKSELYRRYGKPPGGGDLLLEDAFSIDLIQYDALTQTGFDISLFK